MTSTAEILIVASGLTRAEWDTLLTNINALIVANKTTIASLAVDRFRSFYNETPP